MSAGLSYMIRPIRAAGFVPPPWSCDAHCHIWGPIDRFPFASPRPYTPPERDKIAVAALHARLGLERAVLVQPVVHGTDNRAMAADLLELEPVIDGLPVPFVIDHMGRIDAAAGLEQPPFARLLALTARENCWVKLSGADRISAASAPFRDAVPFARALLAAAPDRVLWGTDFPHPLPRHAVQEDRDLLDLLPLLGDAVQLRKLLVDNPARLYGFDPC